MKQIQTQRDVFFGTPTNGCASVGQTVRTNQLCAGTGCNLGNLLGAMDDRNEESESRKSMVAACLDDDIDFRSIKHENWDISSFD